MRTRHRPLFILLSWLLVFPISCNAAALKPKLILAIVVDQFRYDYLTRFRADYHDGIARLLDNGAVFTDARYIQYPTVTAVGHSTFLSGATPSVSGIIDNAWYDRDEKREVQSITDGKARLVGTDREAEGASPRRLLVSTLGDELKIAGRAARVIGMSIKDRGAILPAGHLADAAYWLDAGKDHWSGFVSSDYYFPKKKLPDWVTDFNNAHPRARFARLEWKELDTGKTFCTIEDKTCPSIEYTYFGNQLLEEFAEKTIESENLGGHDGIDILTVSFSSNDYVGHTVGPDAPAVRDISRRTDQELGKLLRFIDARIGLDNALIVFTADHGVAPEPHVQRGDERTMPGDWLGEEEYASRIGMALSGKFGRNSAFVAGDWFLNRRLSINLLYLDYDTIAKANADVVEVRRFAADVARGLPHLARVHTRDELLHGLTPPDAVGRAMQLGFYGPRSPDLVLLPEPYYMFAAQRSGTTHSTPYSYDTHVPLIFFGSGIRAGLFQNPVTINDVAPTLAALLQVETPSGSSGRILTEIMQ